MKTMERMVRSFGNIPCLGYIQTSLRNGSRTCGIYALRISRSFLQFQPPATKDRFSDDNPLIRCTLHCFSIFPSLSPSVSIFFFFRDRNCYSRILFSFRARDVFTCAFFYLFSNDENAGQLCLEEEERRVEKWLGEEGRRGESWRDTRDKGEADEESILLCVRAFDDKEYFSGADSSSVAFAAPTI